MADGDFGCGPPDSQDDEEAADGGSERQSED